MRTDTLILASAGSLAALVLAGCAENHPPRPLPAVRVEVVTSGTKAADGMVVYSAVAQPKTTTPLAFRGPGYVEHILTVRTTDGRSHELGKGDRVRRGDVVARLREAEYRDQVDQALGQVGSARAAAEKARLDFDRATRLFATNSITKPEMEAATAQRDATASELAMAQAALEEARVALRDTALVAPMDGDVLEKKVELGAFMPTGIPAFVVGDVSAVKVVLGLPDVALQGVALGQEVKVTTDALPGRTFTARVSRIAAAADPVARNFDVEVEIPNGDRLWRPGMIAAVELGNLPAQQAAPTLPLTAFVAPGAEKFAVMVVDGEGAEAHARLRNVDIGEVTGNRVAVLRGLAPGERVIVVGASMVTDGEPVEVMPTEVP